MQKMGKWRIGDFDRKRSPDPVLDHAAFVHNIVTGLDKKPHLFKKPIGEFLLNQDYFNGAPRALRAPRFHDLCFVSYSPNSHLLRFSDLFLMNLFCLLFSRNRELPPRGGSSPRVHCPHDHGRHPPRRFTHISTILCF